MRSATADTAEQELLSTKIYRPPLPADCVQRSDLLRLLEAGRSRPLTLVSAPAGYGKSVLVSNWLEASEWASVWVSLNEDDSDLQRFLRYVSAAVRQRFPQDLETTSSLSQATEPPEMQAIANILSNELNAIDQPFFLVLDDFHRIPAGSAVFDVLRILLDHPPIPLHLVLITRRDPPLPLGRLRGLGQVTEVRMQDLRFSASETQDLLGKVTQVRASEDAIANLERELEGWVAGLRLMTLALRGIPDPEAFMKEFRGGTQQMQEYLIGEVVAGLPKPLRGGLLRCALLDRFCAPLCEAMGIDANGEEAAATTGREFIELLQTANLFLIPLDAYGQWFRFHHLFQNLLQQELSRQLDVETIAALHMRASRWFEENELIEDAIRSALKSGDPDAAADILERHRLDELERVRFYVIDRWLEVLNSSSAGRPSLQLAEAFVALHRYNVPRFAAILEQVAPVIEQDPDCADLIGELRCLQGVLSYRMCDGEAGQKRLEEARHRFRTSQRRGIAGVAAFHETLSHVLCGHGDEAIAQTEDRAAAAANDSPIYRSLMLAGLAYGRYLQGDLARAADDAMRAESLAQTGGVEFAHRLSIYFHAICDLHRGNFEAASQRFGAMAQRRYGMPRYAAFVAMAGLALCHQFLQNERAATRAAGNLRTFALELNDANGLEIAGSCEARIQLLQGELDRAARWAGFDGAPPEFAELSNSQEVAAFTRARVWIALGTDESLGRAYRLLQESGERTRNWHFTNQTIEVDVLISLALAGLGRQDEALACLAETINHAAPGGWLRPFLEPGKPMADLLAALDGHGLATDFSRQLLSEIHARRARQASHAAAGSSTQVTLEDGLRETLTNRELEILGLLADRLQNKEIARKLSVSPETVKTHLKNLYSKLGVNSRREAAARSKAILAAAPGPRRSDGQT